MKASIVRWLPRAYRGLESAELSTLEARKWFVRENHLVKKFKMPSHTLAGTLVRDVAIAADAMGHHPQVHVQYRFATFILQTNDTGGSLSDYDAKLASEIDKLADDIVMANANAKTSDQSQKD